ncbi:hypothetical protein ACUN9W_04845, partial [Escherichia coli]
AKLKDGTGFYWLPPSLPGWAIPASDNKPSPENTNQKSPSVDCEQILKDFSDYASTETDKKKLIERYQRDWQLMAGNEEAQAKCVQVMNITWIVKSFDEDVDYYVPVAEIEKLENQHFDEITKAGLKNGN